MTLWRRSGLPGHNVALPADGVARRGGQWRRDCQWRVQVSKASTTPPPPPTTASSRFVISVQCPFVHPFHPHGWCVRARMAEPVRAQSAAYGAIAHTHRLLADLGSEPVLMMLLVLLWIHKGGAIRHTKRLLEIGLHHHPFSAPLRVTDSNDSLTSECRVRLQLHPRLPLHTIYLFIDVA